MSVIDSFLVGIGFEVDESSEKAAEGSMASLSSTFVAGAATMGAAMVGVGVAVTNTAVDLDYLGKQARLMSNTSVEDISRMEYVMESFGGGINDAIGIYTNMEDLFAKSKIGEIDYEGYAKAGISNIAELIEGSETSDELLRNLMGQYGGLSDAQKRLVRDTVGLTDAQAAMFEEGENGYDAMISRADELGTVTDEMATAGENITQAWGDADRALDGIWNTITQKVEDPFTDLIGGFTDGLVGLKGIIEDVELTDTNVETGEEEITGDAVQATGAATTMAGVLSLLAGGALTAATAVVPLIAPLTVPIIAPLITGGAITAAAGLGIGAVGVGIEAYDDANGTFGPKEDDQEQPTTEQVGYYGLGGATPYDVTLPDLVAGDVSTSENNAFDQSSVNNENNAFDQSSVNNENNAFDQSSVNNENNAFDQSSVNDNSNVYSIDNSRYSPAGDTIGGNTSSNTEQNINITAPITVEAADNPVATADAINKHIGAITKSVMDNTKGSMAS